jgi:site-specific DNA recombinase
MSCTDKVAIYARVSTDEQAKKMASIPNQIESLEKYCANQGLEIYGRYKDEGWSGATLDRPELQRLLSDARDNKFKMVLVHRTDRLARSIPLTVSLVLQTFDKMNISFVSITEPYDTSTPGGRMFFVQLASFADFERELIRERMTEGRLRKARSGKWVAATAHYAYDVDKNQNLVLNPERAKIFRQIIAWTLEGKSGRWIEGKLNSMGIPPYSDVKGFKRKHSYHKWHQSNIRDMVLNPIIIGQADFAGIKISAPPIITEEQFNWIKRQYVKNKANARRNTHHFYLLRGILFCKRCGSLLWGRKKTRIRGSGLVYKFSQYYCPRASSHSPCGMRPINIPLVEDRVWELAQNLVMDSKKLTDAVKARNMDLFANKLVTEDRLAEYDKSIKSLKAELDRLLSLYSQGQIFTVEELDAKARKVKAEIADINIARDSLLKTEERLSEQRSHLNNAMEYFKSIRTRLAAFSQEERRKLVERLFPVIKVEWDETKKVHTLDIEGDISIFPPSNVELSGGSPAVNDAHRKRSGGR